MGSPAALAARYGYPTQYNAYDTQFAGAKECIGWTWWDTVAFTSNATTALAAFTAIRATLNLGNMEVAGQLASPKAFFLRAIRVKFLVQPYATTIHATGAIQPGLLNDMQQISETGVLQITIGSKVYGQWPLWMLPAGGGIQEQGLSGGGVAVIADYVNNGIADTRSVYSLTKPLFISPQINFKCDLLWPAGVIVLGTTSPFNIWIGLDGDLIRPVQ
jgi:hypothetical protein